MPATYSIVAESTTDSPEDLDLRGLVCSILHEYRESSHTGDRTVTFVDEHPYAIIRADRPATSFALRTILDSSVRSAVSGVAIVRLYSTEEELCIELSDGTHKPRHSSETAQGAANARAIAEVSADLEMIQRILAPSRASFHARRDSAGAVFTIAFDRSGV